MMKIETNLFFLFVYARGEEEIKFDRNDIK